MKKLRAAILILIGVSTNAIALINAVDPHVAALNIPLKLSKQQAQKLNKVFTETQDKIQALRKEIKAVNKERQIGIDAILTTEQKKKYEDMITPKLPLDGEPPQRMPMAIEPEQPTAK
jgi:Skp family chaperone for outer membrane proteins